MRSHDAAEATRYRQPFKNHHLRLLIKNGAGLYVDYSATLGRNWIREFRLSCAIDQLVMSGSAMLLREDTLTGVSLAPTMASIAHTGGLPAIMEGRAMQVLVAVTEPGVAPVVGDWRELVLGEIDDVEYGKRAPELMLYWRDIGCRVLDYVIKVERPYAQTPETQPMPVVMQQMLDDNLGAGVVTLYDRDAIDFGVNPYIQKKESLLEALNALSAQAGFVVRYKYDAAGVFRLTLYNPLRDRTTVDAEFTAGQYRDLPTLKRSRSDVRNQVEVSYVDIGNVRASIYVEDAPSIAKYGPRYMELGLEFADQIRDVFRANNLGNAALKDLKEPLAEHTTELPLFMPTELGDRYTWGANGRQYDTGQTLAVWSFDHVFTSPGKAYTTMGSRGTVAGFTERWLKAGDVGLRERGIAGTLVNFREGPSDVDSVSHQWDASPVDHVDVYRVEQPTDATTDPWPLLTDPPDDVIPHASVFNLPYLYTSMRPTSDGVTAFVMFVPRDSAGLPGTVEHVRIERLPEAQRNAPSLDLTAAVVDAVSGTTVDLTLSITDPRLLGGTLDVIVNKSSLANANHATDAVQGTLGVASTPQLLGPTAVFALPGGGFDTLFNDVLVHASAGKRVAFKFTNSAGDTTGWQTFVVQGGGGVITAVGQILAGAVGITQHATGLRPVRIVSALPGSSGLIEGDTAYLTTDDKLYRWTGSAWTTAQSTDDLSGTISAAQIAANAIDNTKVAIGLRLPRIVSALPGSSGLIEGDTAYLTTDDKLYRWTGSAWTTAQSTADLSGQITTTQITDNAVTTSKITALNITSGLLAAGAVVAGKISADAVTAGTIAAAAISAREIAAGAITASKLFVGPMPRLALNADPNMLDQAMWNNISGSFGLSSGIQYPGGIGAGLTTDGIATQISNMDRVVYDPTRAYRASVWIFRPAAANGPCWPYIDFLDASGVHINGTVTGNSYHYFPATHGGYGSPPTPSDQWLQYTVAFGAGVPGNPFYAGTDPVPSNAKFMLIGALLNWITPATNHFFFAGFRIEENVGTTLIENGAITTDKITALNITSALLATGAVVAGKIAADAVTAGTIAAAAISAREIAAGAITASKLSVGYFSGMALNSDPAMSDIASWSITFGSVVRANVSAPGTQFAFYSSNPAGTNIFDQRYVPLDLNKSYRAQMRVYRPTGTNGAIYSLVDFTDANYTTMGSGAGAFWYYGTYIGSLPPADTWVLQQVIFGGPYGWPFAGGGAPVGAYFMRVGALLNYGGSTGQYYMADVRLEEVLSATLIEDGAITTNKILAGAVTAAKVSVGTLSELSPNAGIVTNGRLQNVDNTTYIDLSVPSGSSSAVFHHPAFELLGNGSATFSGTVSGASFSASLAVFGNDVHVDNKLWCSFFSGVPDGVGGTNPIYWTTPSGFWFQMTEPTAAGQTALHVFIQGSMSIPKRVSVGASNSGGTGKRMLVCDN